MGFARRFRRTLWVLGIVYVLLLAFSFLWAHFFAAPRGGGSGSASRVPQSFQQAQAVQKKNIATAPRAGAGDGRLVAEKYEKMGELELATPSFDQDAEQLRGIIAAHEGMVQYEKASGIAPRRFLSLSVGVVPGSFDALFKSLQGVGEMRRSDVALVNLTNEFLSLNAKRASLLKTMAGLQELQRQPGSIPDYIELQNRILQVEEELQRLGVSLGDYDETNSFCTVNLTLQETYTVPAQKRSVLRSLRTALEHSALLYASFLGLVLLACLAALALLCVLERARRLASAWEGADPS